VRGTREVGKPLEHQVGNLSPFDHAICSGRRIVTSSRMTARIATHTAMFR
jgi:hypothetical protein